MSYRTWNTYGYGICVDDINTTAQKLLKLAKTNEHVLKDVRDYLNEIYPDGYDDEELTLDDFEELEGDYCEHGVAYVLYQVINDILVVFADDYDGVPYILYTPSFPWNMQTKEVNLTEEKVESIFRKYIDILTNEPVTFDYYNVENGG